MPDLSSSILLTLTAPELPATDPNSYGATHIASTAAIALATLRRACELKDEPLRSQTVIIRGAGERGRATARAIRTAMRANGMTWRASGARVFVVDADGLTLTSDEGSSAERRVATRPEAIEGWTFEGERPSLIETIQRTGATALIGLSGQANAFSKEVVQAMCASVSRPVILPFSWPEGRNEARWEDIAAWSSGSAIAAGVEASPDESGCPEAWLIPGMTIGCVIADATIIDDGMVMAAARAMYRQMSGEDDHLIPSASALPEVTQSVAIEVVRAAMRSGTATNPNLDFTDVEGYVVRRMKGETEELGSRSQDHGWEDLNRG